MEIVESIHQVDGVNANVYLAIDGEELTVIDTGMPKSTEKILDYVRKIGFQPSSISKILLTHCHIDNVGSAYELRKLTKAEVAVHQEDADFVAGKEPLPTKKDIFSKLFKDFLTPFEFTPVTPDILLKENDKVGRFLVIHTPGHTPGSISLYDPARKVLFVGDAVRSVRSVRFIRGKVACPNDSSMRFVLDIYQALKSIEKISHLEFDVMLSGHGSPLKPNASDHVKEFCSSVRKPPVCEYTLTNLGKIKVDVEPKKEETKYFIEVEKPVLKRGLIEKSKEADLITKEKDMFEKETSFTVTDPRHLELDVPSNNAEICSKYVALFITMLNTTYWESTHQSRTIH